MPETIIIKCEQAMKEFIKTVSNLAFLGRKFYYHDMDDKHLTIEKGIVKDLQEILTDPIEEVDVISCAHGMRDFIITVSNKEFLGRRFYCCKMGKKYLCIEREIAKELQEILTDPIEEVTLADVATNIAKA